MDLSMFGAASDALLLILEPYRLAILASGVLMGLALGIVPGIGGLVGMALLLPFTFTMDPYTAFALLLGMSAVTGTSDTIPAVLFGVPGSSSAQATVMDGNPMAKRGEAGRALSAAFTASLIGGLFGALILAVSIPVLRPFVLYIQSPELLALSIFGISMVAVLSGSAPLRGLAIAGFGVLLSMIGSDPQTGTMRWTMGQLYLWDGLPMVPMILGLFALPELAELAIKRTAISSEAKYDARSGMLQGMRDALRHWWLVLRCGSMGAAVGAIPGLGPSVVDWLAYGHAVQTEKGAKQTFGKGDVRGVIAPESANNSITAGSLIPTIAFGVPGSASMAILLGAFLMHGLVPGPDMLTIHLDITYSMIWSVAIANILGAGLCFAFSGQLAKLAALRYTLFLPIVLSIVFIGAYQATRSWGDLYTLLGFSIVGFAMKRFGWARPPLVLGFVLGALIERYMFISIGRYGADWLTRPLVMIFLGLAVLTVVSPLAKDWARSRKSSGRKIVLGRPRFQIADGFYVLLILTMALMMSQSHHWSFSARIAPQLVGWFALAAVSLSFVWQVMSRGATTHAQGMVAEGDGMDQSDQAIHMDIGLDLSELTPREQLQRTALFAGWLLVFMASLALIGMIPTVLLFIVAYMRLEGKERWGVTLGLAAGVTVFVYVVFDHYLSLPWPPSLLGAWMPQLRDLVPSM